MSNYLYSSYNRNLRSGGSGGLFALLAVAVVGLIVFYFISYYSEDTQICTVEDKDRASGQNGSDMRVYTEECGNLAVADALFKGHFSSSDVYADIEPGQKYEFTTIGFRVPLLSMFPNIIEAEPVE